VREKKGGGCKKKAKLFTRKVGKYLHYNLDYGGAFENSQF